MLIYLNELKVRCTHDSSMSAEHAGTRKWSKMLKSHSNKRSQVDKVHLSGMNRLRLVILFEVLSSLIFNFFLLWLCLRINTTKCTERSSD